MLIVVESCVYDDAVQDFSVWLRTGSNPEGINRFRSHTGKTLLVRCLILILSCNYVSSLSLKIL